MALEQKSGISENNNLLSGLSIPAEVVAQQKKNNGKIDDGINQRDESIVNLFFLLILLILLSIRQAQAIGRLY